MNDQHESLVSIDRTLARIRALSRRSERDAQRVFWAEGIRNFLAACEANWDFDTIVVSPVLLKSSLVRERIEHALNRGVRRARVTPEQFRSISTTEHASGIGAIVRQRWTRLSRADPRRGLCWLAIDELRSPGNLGTILRTAEACGAAGAIFLSPRTDPFDPSVVRATMGGLFHLSLVQAAPEHLAHWLATRGVRLVGLSPDAERRWDEVAIAGPTAIALGEERGGLSCGLRRLCHANARLPMTGRADSLNVGIAAGVMLYELVRRGGTDDVSD